MLGTHLLKHWASTQKKITFSSGEAELGAVVKSFSEVLGIQSVARDLGVELNPEVHADNSAAIGICNRCATLQSHSFGCRTWLGPKLAACSRCCVQKTRQTL